MSRRECPSCGLVVEGPRETCPSCLATLVDDADATIACPQCGHVCPARMQSCPECLAMLRPDPEDVEEFFSHELSEGRRVHRPLDQPPFASGPSCTVLRLMPNGGLVLAGPEGLIEAGVQSHDDAAIPPLVCARGASTVLFRLEWYQPAKRSLVAIGADGAPIGTYLHAGALLERIIDVRDETSAPVARFQPSRRGDYEVLETGGGILATGSHRDVELKGWIDDEWSLTTRTSTLPMKPLAFVALALAAKVLFGRPKPVQRPERRPEKEDIFGDLAEQLFRME